MGNQPWPQLHNRIRERSIDHSWQNMENETSVIFVAMLILEPWEQLSGCVITLPDDQLGPYFIIWFLLLISSHILTIKIM